MLQQNSCWRVNKVIFKMWVSSEDGAIDCCITFWIMTHTVDIRTWGTRNAFELVGISKWRSIKQWDVTGRKNVLQTKNRGKKEKSWERKTRKLTSSQNQAYYLLNKKKCDKLSRNGLSQTRKGEERLSICVGSKWRRAWSC